MQFKVICNLGHAFQSNLQFGSCLFQCIFPNLGHAFQSIFQFGSFGFIFMVILPYHSALGCSYSLIILLIFYPPSLRPYSLSFLSLPPLLHYFLTPSPSLALHITFLFSRITHHFLFYSFLFSSIALHSILLHYIIFSSILHLEDF